METLGEKTFEVSEMYIFGKFEAFCKRLEKVSVVLLLIKNKNNACSISACSLMFTYVLVKLVAVKLFISVSS